MELVFATNNKHKLEELQALLGDKVKLLSLKDIACFEDIPEELDAYISMLESELNIPITIVSVGPNRLQTLHREAVAI